MHFLLATKRDLAEPILYGGVFAALLGVRLAGLRRRATR
jgi:DMSO/TMAO reductase YedYZ heme-binding membrane subunit